MAAVVADSRASATDIRPSTRREDPDATALRRGADWVRGGPASRSAVVVCDVVAAGAVLIGTIVRRRRTPCLGLSRGRRNRETVEELNTSAA